MFGSYRNEVIDFIYKLTDLFVYEYNVFLNGLSNWCLFVISKRMAVGIYLFKATVEIPEQCVKSTQI